jgi:hypothetical protein
MRSLMAIVLLGCDPIADDAYQGEPIGTLRGQITSDLESTPPAEVILAWINWRTDPGTVVGTRVPVEGTFPLGFTMTLYVPPPDGALNALPEDRYAGDAEPRVGFAWILVLRQGATPPDTNVIAHADIKGLQPGDVLGWAEDHIYAYVDRTVPDASYAEEILGAELSPGFHLMEAAGRGGADLDAIRACKAMGLDSSTCTPMIEPLRPATERQSGEVPIRLTAELESLRLPVFALPSAVERAFGIGGG